MNLTVLDDAHWRRTLDHAADSAAKRILTAGGPDAISVSLELLSNVPPAKPWPDGLKEYVAQTVPPPDADWKRVERAQEWFSTWGVLGTASLFCASLPETYCLPGIARLLGISGQLRDHVTRRIKMTGQMLFDVMGPNGFDEGGRALKSLQRTRLMHASLRMMLLGDFNRMRSTTRDTPQQAELVWTGLYGLPINQLELAYTLLTFSYIVLRSLMKLGVRPEPEIANDYLYTWNVAGQVLGIDPTLMPETYDDAEQMFERIKTTAEAIDDTFELMTALETCWCEQFAEHHLPLARPLMHMLFHELLPDGTRQFLKIPDLPHRQDMLNNLLLPTVRTVVHVADGIFATLPPVAHAAAAVNHFFAIQNADIKDGGLYDTAKHMRAWFDQVSSPTSRI